MYTYDVNCLLGKLEGIIQQHVEAPVWSWLLQNRIFISDSKFNTAFALVPRKVGKGILTISKEQQVDIATIRPDFFINGWTMDRLCRVWLLLQLDASEKEEYAGKIELLFLGAEMNELVALYSALPVLAYPQHWRKRCSEGIRSNIGDVLLAIICNNPYPAEQLDDAAWNQMVLKAFFTEKPVHQIVGLDDRSNKDLAKILSDYAHERWAAHRSVNPLLWRCVSPFIDEALYPDIKKIASSTNPLEREAALLACSKSAYLPAKELLRQYVVSQTYTDETISWDHIAQQSAVAVA
ncbi:EboA domain-containing protein [Flavisolibacter tropicus]|uniref:EboA domain-containing protein n=1 Tax=Flavisolibacter tropicus TaxID=1492898 RepID=UPI0009EE8681|nr:EboA domain-containing protein [Flavisolibacter tropicus]